VQHLDPDRLVLLALSESSAEQDESVHLAGCAGCRGEIDAVKYVAEVGAETQSLRDLPPPPDRVWAGIAADVAQAASPDHAVLRLPSGARRPAASRRRSRRWVTPALAAAAAAVLAIAGTVTVTRLTDRPPPPAVTAKAALSPLAPAPPSARGDAEVLSGEQLRLAVANLPLTTGYYEIWLLNPDDTTKMLSIGNLPGRAGDVTLPIPPGTDLNMYRLVDISAEAHDGNSAHSGDSLLRGTLTN
jgi:hypothetical protein